MSKSSSCKIPSNDRDASSGLSGAFCDSISAYATFDLLDLGTLRRHEQHDKSTAVRLSKEIDRLSMWTSYLLVEKVNKIILDGHHRFAAASILYLRRIPCVIVDYDRGPVEVSSWREGYKVTKERVLTAGLYGRLLPEKTSRHIVNLPIPTCSFLLSDLRSCG